MKDWLTIGYCAVLALSLGSLSVVVMQFLFNNLAVINTKGLDCTSAKVRYSDTVFTGQRQIVLDCIPRRK